MLSRSSVQLWQYHSSSGMLSRLAQYVWHAQSQPACRDTHMQTRQTACGLLQEAAELPETTGWTAYNNAIA